MVVADTTADEKIAIDTLRKQLSAFKIDKYEDGMVLRFLRVNSGNIDAAEAALKKHLIFRKAWALDDKDWTPPEVLRKYYGYGFPGYDKEGSPVLIELFGDIDPEGLMKSCAVSDYIKIALRNTEEGLRKCREIAKQKNKPYEQILFIMDMQGMTSSHYTYKPFTNSYLTLVTTFQENYPLVFKKILVLRAPSMAQVGYSLLSPFLGENTQQAVSMPGENWRDILAGLAELSELPRKCGGEQDDDKAVNMHIPEKPIPEAYFYKPHPADSDMTNVTVYASDKHITDCEVTEPGTRLCWRYKTAAEDIGFAIYYNPGGEATELSEMEPVFPYIRVECHAVPESGSIICDKAGTYVVEFDNYYSWFSAKEISYRINLV